MTWRQHYTYVARDDMAAGLRLRGTGCAYVAGPDVIQQELTFPITGIQELSSLHFTDGELQVLLSHGIPASLHLPSPSSSFHVYKNE